MGQVFGNHLSNQLKKTAQFSVPSSTKICDRVELISEPDSTVSTQEISPGADRETLIKEISSEDDRTTLINEQLHQEPRFAVQPYQELCSKDLLC